MGPRARVRASLSAAVLAVLVAAPAASAGGPLNQPWPQLLPPIGAHQVVDSGGQPGCPVTSIRCVDRALAKMDALRRGFGCDHRALFAMTYQRLTERLRASMLVEPSPYRDRPRLFDETALFAHYYFRTVDLPQAQRPAAWQIAFDAAARKDVTALQDLLLGVNAHVQRDMPFVLATVGLRTADGRSTKPDHDFVNDVLESAYRPIVEEVQRVYDPRTSIVASPLHPLDDVAALELIKVWREGVWRNAEALLDAPNAAARARVAQRIELAAATTARAIVGFQVPGHRTTRDAYCAANLPG